MRRKVAGALGEFQSDKAAELLIQLIKKDKSPYVIADATAALGSTQTSGALKRLEKLAKRSSHDEAIARAA